MGKDSKSAGTSVFGQLISMLSKNDIAHAIQLHHSDRYTKKFKTWDHLVTILYGTLSKCSSLREVISGLAGYQSKLLHLGLNCFPTKSTLSDANAKRSADVFEDIFKLCYKKFRPFLPDSLPKNQQWLQKLFLVDSSTITLFKNIMKACGRTPANGKRKGGVKLHVGMHLSEETAGMVRITSAATHDKNFMKDFKSMEPGTILVFDKAYVNFHLYNHWTDNRVWFVTRLKRSFVITYLKEYAVSEDQRAIGVLSDNLVELGNKSQGNKVQVRLIRFYDDEKKRTFEFISNNPDLTPGEIAQIYKQRWQIELLFKRLKQNLQLYDFYGDNENAIRIQIWCCLIADLLLTVLRKGLKKAKAYSNIAALIRLHLMNYVAVYKLLNSPGDKSIFENNKTYGQKSIRFANAP